MKIGIFTGRLLDPLHPRIVSYIEFFDNHGLNYEIVPPVNNQILSRINWFSLYFFDLYSTLRNRKKIKLYDIILIQDLKYLPLARLAKKKKKTVIYETLDNNVVLRGYQLLKKLPFLTVLKNSIISHYSLKEKKIAFNHCDKIIVNSKALVKYFEGKAQLIYYCSSFETIKTKNNAKLKPALLYLGEFSLEKGADDVIALQKKLEIELYIFGTIRNHSIKESILGNNKIYNTTRLNHKELILRLEDLLRQYYLIGTSFIKPVHLSYATQEANKEIDYLAMGIPIIGNHREPTEEKILAGCGIFLENDHQLKQLFSDEDFRKKLSLNCLNYYVGNYSITLFNTGIDKALSQFTDKNE
ncbi:MAG TPA: hypothetical protein VMV77_19450 [Bacteroidales bacterium]|nr:hypothetical protein [Bacteroidales bacterium]